MSDFSNLPPELVRELSKEVRPLDPVRRSIKDALTEGDKSINQLLVIIYKDTGCVLKRVQLTSLLYRLKLKKLVRKSGHSMYKLGEWVEVTDD